jgi:hypothetical protein
LTAALAARLARIRHIPQGRRCAREVEPEGAALTCCESLGLPGADFARGYFQHWLEGDRIPEKPAQRIIPVATYSNW